MSDLDEDYKEILRQCAELKNQELEFLGSMYNVPDELEFENLSASPSTSNDENLEILNREDFPTTSEMDFTLKLKLNNFDVELTFHLPEMYPVLEKLRIFIRCNDLSSNLCLDFNQNLRIFVENLPLKGPQINSCIDFISSNFEKLEKPVDQRCGGKFTLEHGLSSKLTRYWIYSHHIYSKIKRRNIKSLTDQLNLNGFCLPGKPAVICVQGQMTQCRQFWDEIKLWSWKKIVLKFEEEICLEKEEKRLFENFSEIQMDMKEFKSLLETYDSGFIFNILFGLGE